MSARFLNRRHAKTRSTAGDRERLNRLYYTNSRPMTGSELRELVESNRIQFTSVDYEHADLQMVVYAEKWITPSLTWEGIAEILNELSVSDQVRSKMTEAPAVIDLMTEGRLRNMI
jgi:hypothetical protein